MRMERGKRVGFEGSDLELHPFGHEALLVDGRSGFNALLGGNVSGDGQYARLEDHGFYRTASESNSDRAWFYNFGRNALSVNRHSDGKKQLGISVRCIRE